jgi:hypothetical protein
MCAGPSWSCIQDGNTAKSKNCEFVYLIFIQVKALNHDPKHKNKWIEEISGACSMLIYASYDSTHLEKYDAQQ